jgi:hypothetical protein
MRFLSFFFGFLGGLICLGYSFYYLFLDGSEVPISINYAGTLSNLRMALIPLSAIGLIGAFRIPFDLKQAARLTILGSTGILILHAPCYLVGCLLLFFTGILSLVFLKKIY